MTENELILFTCNYMEKTESVNDQNLGTEVPLYFHFRISATLAALGYTVHLFNTPSSAID